MKNLPVPRLDKNPDLRKHLLKYCRFKDRTAARLNKRFNKRG
jgi:hypothetical protein